MWIYKLIILQSAFVTVLGFASVKGILWIPNQEILVSGIYLADLMSLYLLPALPGWRGL